jgi:hypothetical protein
MRQSPPNARFWVYWNDQYTKLTLRPGEELSFSQGGRTDEGWFRNSETYEYQYEHDTPPRIVVSVENAGADCDGRLDRYYQSACDVDQLQARLVDESDCLWEYPDVRGLRLPQWQPLSAHQRDYAAEAMGY